MGLQAYFFSVRWIEDEQQNPFSVVCSQRTSLYTVTNIYKEDYFLPKYMQYRFSAGTLERTEIVSSGKTTVHEPAQLTKVALGRVS